MTPVPPPADRAHRPWVMLFLARSGSTWLTSMLGSHPGVRAEYEVLARMRKEGEDADAQLRWATRFWTPTRFRRPRAVGFKTKLREVLDRDRFAALLHRVDARVIHLHRENRVKALVSFDRAQRLHRRTGRWNRFRVPRTLKALRRRLAGAPDGDEAIRIDAEEFVHWLEARRRSEADLEAWLDAVDRPVHHLTYEGLVSDREATLSGVLDFLGLERRPLRDGTVKHTPDDLSLVVENLDELRDALAGTEHAAMLEQGHPGAEEVRGGRDRDAATR